MVWLRRFRGSRGGLMSLLGFSSVLQDLAHYCALLPAPLHEVQQRWSLNERWAAVRTTLTGLNPRQTRSPSILGVQSTLLTALPHSRSGACGTR